MSCCSICLEDVVFDEKTLTPCGHSFHAACVDRWHSGSMTNTCPNCRRQAENSVVKKWTCWVVVALDFDM